jgi:murein DD-endopeptidase MepM/ murein hydrolase activator NlpD
MTRNLLPWVVGGGTLALVAYTWPRREAVSDDDLPGNWVWPVGVWQGRRPEISDGFRGTRRDAKGQIIQHGGVDIMYRRLAADPWQPGTPNGSRGWVMPNQRAALAASDGVIWFAAHTPRGWSVIIDHSPRKLASYYTHLASLRVSSKQNVKAGDILGTIGADPLDAAHLSHLHFEIWRGASTTRFDPEPYMRRWKYLPDPGDVPLVNVA